MEKIVIVGGVASGAKEATKVCIIFDNAKIKIELTKS